MKATGICLTGCPAMLVGVVLLVGCSAHKPTRADARAFVPRDCIEAVELTPSTTCSGPDEAHLQCQKMLLRVHAGCAQLQVVPHQPKRASNAPDGEQLDTLGAPNQSPHQ